MKKRIFFLFLSLVGVAAIAQPNYSTKIYQVKKGLKTNQYSREAKHFIKIGNYNAAAINAAYALKLATKKRHITSAQDYLNASYNRAIQANLNKIEVLEDNTEIFEGDQTVTNLAEIVRLYKTMQACNNILKEIPKKSFKPAKRKRLGFNPKIEEYTSFVSASKKHLKESKEKAAAKHYTEGRELENKEGKLNFRMAAKKYRWSYEYVPNYRDAKERYAETKKLGTTRLALINFKSNSTQYGDLGAAISDEILNYLANGTSYLEFFEVLDRNQLDVITKEQRLSLSGLMDESTTVDIGELRGVDAILVGSVTRSFIDRQKLGAKNQNYSKEIIIRTENYIDSEGKKRTRNIKGTVYAEATIHRKKAEAYVKCSYKILDVKTGAITYSNSSTGIYNWDEKWVENYTGDKRALPANINKSEPSYPSYGKMINIASSKVAVKISLRLTQYATEVGK